MIKFLKNFINKFFGIQNAHNIFWYLAIIKRVFIRPKKYRSMMDIFNKKKYFVIKKSQLLFSLRDLGNNSISRGKNFFLKEPKTISWIDNFSPNSNFLDIGANIGIFSLYAAHKGHNVVSVEPESLNFAALNININDNDFNQNIKTYPFSINSENSIGLLELSEVNWGKSGHSFDTKPSNIDGKKIFQGSYGCSVDFLSKEIDFIPDYIKIDVDGNELKVIYGMEKLLQNQSIKGILVEIDVNKKENTKIINFLSKFHYKTISKDIVVPNQPNIVNYIFSI